MTFKRILTTLGRLTLMLFRAAFAIMVAIISGFFALVILALRNAGANDVGKVQENESSEYFDRLEKANYDERYML